MIGDEVNCGECNKSFEEQFGEEVAASCIVRLCPDCCQKAKTWLSLEVASWLLAEQKDVNLAMRQRKAIHQADERDIWQQLIVAVVDTLNRVPNGVEELLEYIRNEHHNVVVDTIWEYESDVRELLGNKCDDCARCEECDLRSVLVSIKDIVEGEM